MKNLYNISLSKSFVFLSICFSLLCVQAQAQVSIAPTSLFFNNQQRFSSLAISNGSDKPQEISITMDFAYPTSKDGKLVITEDSLLAPKKSIASNIKAFPQNFTIQPQQRQVVRFVMQPPQNIEPGGYWARVTITSNPVSQPIENTAGENRIGTQINIVLKQVISAHYRTQNALTGLKINNIDFNNDKEENRGTIALDMEQTGNAPFVGSMAIQITDAKGNTVYQTNATTSVYTTITRSFPVETSNWDAGTYTITGTITSRRRDIGADKLLQIQPVSFKKQITIE